jgi:hypothetical protein
MKNLLKHLLRENIFSEEYDAGTKKLYGYHVTGSHPETLKSIKTNGFRIGPGQMEGRGFYAFYLLERACGYSSKEYVTNRIIKFEISDLSKVLILDMEVAKEVLGNDYHIANQLDKMFGLDYCYEDCKKIYYDSFPTKEDYVKELYRIEEMQTRDIGPEFSTMHTLVFENSVNVINYGSYGLQYRINDVEIAKPIGYYDLERTTKNIIKYTDL